MRTKRATFDLESDRFARNLHVVMKQLESWILTDSDPYDAGPAKVRKGADAANVHHELAMPSRDRGEDVLDLIDTFRGLLAEEFQGQMQPGLANPCELRCTLTKRRRCLRDIATDVRAEIDREKKTHAGFCVSRRSTPMAR